MSNANRNRIANTIVFLAFWHSLVHVRCFGYEKPIELEQPSAVFSIGANLRHGDLRMCIVDSLKVFIASKAKGRNHEAEDGPTFFYDCCGGRIIAYDPSSGLVYIYVYPFEPSAECAITPLSQDEFTAIGINLTAIKSATSFESTKGYQPTPYFVISARKVVSQQQLEKHLPNSVLTFYASEEVQKRS